MRNRLSKLQRYNLILASRSPRRQMLLRGLDLVFEVKVKNTKEIYPEDMDYVEVPEYLARLKAGAFSRDSLAENSIIITADTIVVLEGEIIGKPKNKEDAKKMLHQLSGKEHTVITGVCLTSIDHQVSFSARSEVFFRHLNKSDIDYYVEEYSPLDKAGSYGIQEWIGYVAIEKIKGSFYNVMGLPTQMLFEELIQFTSVMKY
ncbi:MAG: septum formation protein Maf [Bacteroidetes bacterium]|nr:MAG: septum formation protein Maf [Bacteroidota bacterium]